MNPRCCNETMLLIDGVKLDDLEYMTQLLAFLWKIWLNDTWNLICVLKLLIDTSKIELGESTSDRKFTFWNYWHIRPSCMHQINRMVLNSDMQNY